MLHIVHHNLWRLDQAPERENKNKIKEKTNHTWFMRAIEETQDSINRKESCFCPPCQYWVQTL